MKTLCPSCNEEVEMEINEIEREEGDFYSTDASAPAYINCPKCGRHFTASICYTVSELKWLEPDNNYDEDEEED